MEFEGAIRAMKDLSILIPARNEMFLSRTIHDILENIEADTEVIATLDGNWAKPPIPQHDRVNVIYVSEAIGQRASTNIACRLAQGKYVMKVDAHCAFDKGFDRKMLEGFAQVGDEVTMVPLMRNLHVFNWKCYYCGWEDYMGPKIKVCPQCGKRGKVRMKMVWIGKRNPTSWSYAFDAEPKFRYFEAHKHRPGVRAEAVKTGFSETMSLQGSCFMANREVYWEKQLCDEAMGNWGNQGIEVACKTWLSGGRVMVNHRTWYAHMFRTRDGFAFPWPVSGRDQQMVKKRVRDLLWNGGFSKQIHPVSWLVEKFWPVPGWTQEQLDELKQHERDRV